MLGKLKIKSLYLHPQSGNDARLDSSVGRAHHF